MADRFEQLVGPEAFARSNALAGSVFDTSEDQARRSAQVGGPIGSGGLARGFNALSQIGKVSKLNPAAEADLLSAVKSNAPGAWDAMVKQYTPFVVRLAKKYTKPGGAELDDLVNEGAISMRRAAESFDPSRGDFLNHLSAVLRRDLGNAAYQQGGPMVQVPSNVQRTAGRLSRVTEKYKTITGNKPQIEELEAMTGIPAESIRKLQAGLPERIGSTDIGRLAPQAPTQQAPASDLMKVLNPREQSIVSKIRSGMSLQDIADEAKVSRPAISRVYLRAVAKLTQGEGASRPYPSPPPISGGSGEFPGTSTRAIFNSPQKTAEGNILPPLRDLYQMTDFRGQPSYAPEIARGLDRRAIPNFPPGSAAGAVHLAGRGNNIPGVRQPISIADSARRAEMESSATQLQRLQDLFTSLWFGQARQ